LKQLLDLNDNRIFTELSMTKYLETRYWSYFRKVY
jgi:hypothetical protein